MAAPPPVSLVWDRVAPRAFNVAGHPSLAAASEPREVTAAHALAAGSPALVAVCPAGDQSGTRSPFFSYGRCFFTLWKRHVLTGCVCVLSGLGFVVPYPMGYVSPAAAKLGLPSGIYAAAVRYLQLALHHYLRLLGQCAACVPIAATV